MSATLVRLEGVSKRFGGGPLAVSDVTTTILGGGITALAGPDGAGKTTLLRLMLGLLKPDAGTLTVCDLDPASQAPLLREVVAYMPQRFGLYEDLTVFENLTLYADLRGVTGQQRQSTFERLLTLTGLVPFQCRLAGALSGGMKQKLGLACALVRAPRLLLLDEPSVGVDPISRRDLWRLIRVLAGEGIGIVWSTAYLDEAERCERVLLMNDGKLIYEGVPSELTKKMASRSFHVRNAGAQRRAVLAAAGKRTGVIDAVIQGSNIRIVMAEGAATPSPEEFSKAPGVDVVAVPPRFEDAFINLLGGKSPPVSPLQTAVGARVRNHARTSRALS